MTAPRSPLPATPRDTPPLRNVVGVGAGVVPVVVGAGVTDESVVLVVVLLVLAESVVVVELALVVPVDSTVVVVDVEVDVELSVLVDVLVAVLFCVVVEVAVLQVQQYRSENWILRSNVCCILGDTTGCNARYSGSGSSGILGQGTCSRNGQDEESLNVDTHCGGAICLNEG